MSDNDGESVDFEDMQGLLRFGYGHLPESCFLLLRVADRDAARRWLQRAPVNDARWLPKAPERVLQLAFTHQGLGSLGVGNEALAGFSEPFAAGMAAEGNRSRRLGDEGDNHPRHWRWGGPPSSTPDVLALLYTKPGGLPGWRAQLENEDFALGFELTMELPALATSTREPFGFADGISQPEIDWWGQRSLTPAAKARYRSIMALGELALGYRNEYGLYTERPVLPTNTATARLPEAEDHPGWRDLGRNGTYLVARQLQQDVPGFWRYLDRLAAGEAMQREALAEKMVGRRRDGSPLVVTNGLNDFSFDKDPYGEQCPLGAHVRRANPRTGDFPPGTRGMLSRGLRRLGFCRRHPHDDLVASTRFHRLVRRGRAYGSELPPEEAITAAMDTQERGLHFLCLGANIARQFEFIQNAWINSASFAGLDAESDPLLGSRQPLPGNRERGGFSIPRARQPASRLGSLPQFVAVRGGAYFFMPGLRALAYIAGAR